MQTAFGFFVTAGLILALMAVVLGLAAGYEIRRSKEKIRGIWLARIGMILGFISFFSFLNIPKVLEAKERSWVIGELKKLHMAEQKYRQLYPRIGFSSDLAALGPPEENAPVSWHRAGLVEGDLAGGRICQDWDPILYLPRKGEQDRNVGYTLTAESGGIFHILDETGKLRLDTRWNRKRESEG